MKQLVALTGGFHPSLGLFRCFLNCANLSLTIGVNIFIQTSHFRLPFHAIKGPMTGCINDGNMEMRKPSRKTDMQ